MFIAALIPEYFSFDTLLVKRNVPFLYTVSCTHCMTVSLAQGGKGLGAMWGKELACDMLRQAGFLQVEVKELPHDPINYYYIIRK